MVEKCGDYLIDSPQALNYDARNLLQLQTGGSASPDFAPATDRE